MTNCININWNFSIDLIKKRLNKILNKLNLDNQFTSDTFLDNFILDQQTICLLANNCIFKNIDNHYDIFIKFYPKKQLKLITNTGDFYKEKNGIYLIKSNLIAYFHLKTTTMKELILNNQDIIWDSDRCLVTLKGYQSLGKKYCPIFLKNTEIKNKYKWDHYIFKPGKKPKLKNNKNCYICKKPFDDDFQIDYYNCLCLDCSIFNYEKRLINIDLKDKTALVTGGRAKIGHGIVLRLLRYGCKVITTTRLVNTTVYNYSLAEDYKKWKNKLTIIKCDFTDLKQVNYLIEYCKDKKLDFLINNACQTVKPSKLGIQKLIKLENICKSSITYQSIDINEKINGKIKENINKNQELIKFSSSNVIKLEKQNVILDKQIIKMSMEKYNLHYNSFMTIQEGKYDNSWKHGMGEIDTDEILQSSVINQIIPTLLVNSLIKTMADTKNAIIIQSTPIEKVLGVTGPTGISQPPAA